VCVCVCVCVWGGGGAAMQKFTNIHNLKTL
jgi:hypothetical protein